MAGAGNSCRRYGDTKLQREGRPCEKSCFEPWNGQCADKKINEVVEDKKVVADKNVGAGKKTVSHKEVEPDYKIKEVVNRAPSIIKTFLEPESPVRRQIYIEAECSKCAAKKPENCCNLCQAQNYKHAQNLCSAKCWPTTTLMYKQLSKPVRSKPTHRQTIFLDDNTVVGRAYPMKFHLTRDKPQCSDCGNDLYVRETLTDNNNLILLSNCCNVEVYPHKKIENWHHVTVGTITGQKQFSKKVLSEICVLEPKRIPEPVVIHAHHHHHHKHHNEAVKVKPKKKKKKKDKKKRKH